MRRFPRALARPGAVAYSRAHSVSPDWPARARRHLVALVAVCALISLTGVTALAAPLPAAAQAPAVSVTLTAISPVATAKGTVTAKGSIINTGDVTLTEVTAIFWVGQQQIRSQTELDQAAQESPDDRLGVLITWPIDTMDEMTASLQPGQRSTFALKLTTAELGFTKQGVYPVGVDIRATPVDHGRDTVGRAHTFLAYLPDPSAVGSVDVSFLVPITSAPATIDDATVSNDTLADDVARHGRLTGLLNLFGTNGTNGADRGGALTPMVDPNVLTDAGVLSQAHRGADHHQSHGIPAAAAFLRSTTALFAPAATSPPLVLPLGDPDVTALEHSHLFDQFAGAPAATRSALLAAGLKPTEIKAAGGVTAWPADGLADAATLDALANGGVKTVVLSRDALPELPALPSPTNPLGTRVTAGGGGVNLAPSTQPTKKAAQKKASGKKAAQKKASGKKASQNRAGQNRAGQNRAGQQPPPARTPLGTTRVRISTPDGVLSALVTEPSLLAGGPIGADSSLLVRQRFLAETALIAMGIPASSTYRLIAALPRDFTVARATASTLDPPVAATWLHAAPLAQVTAGAVASYTGTLSDPPVAKAQELTSSVLESLKEYLAAWQRLTSISKPIEAATAATNRASTVRGFLRSASIAWRADPDAGVALATALTHQVNSALAKVELSAPKVVTLSGSSGSFPVTVTNELDQPVTVKVRLSSRDATVIGALADQDTTVDAKRRNGLKFTASSEHSGVATVQAQLFTPDGHPLGPPTRFTVRATQYGVVGWVILGAGVFLLLAAAAYRNIRDYRRRRAAAS